MKLGLNLAAGMGGALWAALLGFAVVPIYLRYLGIEAYGLIGFYATSQALFQILDFGLAPTINREVARASASGEWSEARTLLHTLSVVYWCMAVVIALAMAGSAPYIASYWLQSQQLPTPVVSHAVMLMGIVVACRWPVGLYQGALIGMQKLGQTSALNAATVTAANVGAVAVLAWWSASIEAFFIWQAVVGLASAAVFRWRALRELGVSQAAAKFELEALRKVWRFSAGMVVLAVSGVIFAQLDKLLLSRFLDLTAFGRYTLAAVVVGGLNVIITPFYNAVYPKFSAYVVRSDKRAILELYRTTTRLLATILFSSAMILVICGGDIVSLWTRNSQLAAQVAPLVALLGVGTAIHGVMYVPHAVQLAYGKVFIPLAINLILMVLMVPTIVELAMRYGALGGASAWVILHVLYMGLGTFLTDKYLLPGTGLRWIGREAGLPALVALVVGVLGEFALQKLGGPPLANVAVGCLFYAAAIAASLLISTDLRRIAIGAVRRQFGK